jgi:FtsZ-binding cell division protein ZapB
MTDNEIVKALECCSTYKGKCTDCPAFVKVDRSNCKQVLLGAIEIINRLQADKEYYKKNRDKYQDDVMFLSKQCDELQAENERLQKHIQEGIDLAKQIPEMVATAQAEAIKEFAERLKEKKKSINITIGLDYEVCFVSDIDNLLKELVGEDK